MIGRKQNDHDGYYVESNQNFLVLKMGDIWGWRAAAKRKPVRARIVDLAMTIRTLEGREHVTAGDYLCIGTSNELWPMGATTMEQNFTNRGKIGQDIAVDVLGDGRKTTYSDFCLFEPKHSNAELVSRCEKTVIVEARWGTMHGQPGDYLAKRSEDACNPDPADIWIINRTVFDQSYELLE